MKKNRDIRMKTNFKVREEGEGKCIEGYFAVYNQKTELWPGVRESIASTAFLDSLANNDIRCLFNHVSGSVLGRTGNRTLTLKSDDYGLYGTVQMNEDDKEAMDVYARVKRGDITGCSFGFYPVDEEYTFNDDGSTDILVKSADTSEVSICTFPAYPQTAIQARKEDVESFRAKALELKKQKQKERLKNVTTSAND